MLNNLKAELVRKELHPEKAIMEILGCTHKTASSKLNGKSDFTVPEAIKIMQNYFPNDNFEFEFLFANASSDIIAKRSMIQPIRKEENHGKQNI